MNPLVTPTRADPTCKAVSTGTPPRHLPSHFLRVCILLLLGEQPAHGYELLTRLGGLGFAWTQANGRYADSGAVYRALRTLEELGLVRSVPQASRGAAHRRIYGLTGAGREELHRSSQAITETRDLVGVFLSRYENPVQLSSSGLLHGASAPALRGAIRVSARRLAAIMRGPQAPN